MSYPNIPPGPVDNPQEEFSYKYKYYNYDETLNKKYFTTKKAVKKQATKSK